MVNNNSKFTIGKIAVTKQRTFAVIGIIVLSIAVFVILYYMSNYKSKEEFNTTNNTIEKEAENNEPPNLIVANGECVVALFYADWCPHCQHFKPDYKKAMKHLNGKTDKNGKTLRLVMVDCDAFKELSKKYDVSGYPTVKLINDDGTQEEYPGERTYESLNKYLLSDN